MMPGLGVLHLELRGRNTIRLLVQLVDKVMVNVLNDLDPLVEIIEVGNLVILVVFGPDANDFAFILRLMSLVIRTTFCPCSPG
jgi:hypothetical protein